MPTKPKRDSSHINEVSACPTCGSAVRVVGSAEGTQHFQPVHDPVNAPAHYRSHPSGVECIQITEHMNFSVGNAVKYLWRAGLKADAREDLRKARWYVDREIQRLEGER